MMELKMKKVRCLVLLLVMLIGADFTQAQTFPPPLPRDEASQRISPGRVEGFLSIPWGTSTNQATKVMLLREGVKLDTELDDVFGKKSRELHFSGGLWGEFKATAFVLQFGAEGLFAAKVYLKPDKEEEFLTSWDNVKTALSYKYGAPAIERILYQFPFKDGDGLEADAFKAGKGDAVCMWNFEADDKRSVGVWTVIDQNLNTIVIYQNDDMGLRVMQKNQKKIWKDY